MANVSSRLEELIKIIEETRRDAVKFDYHNNSSAGLRVRKSMQEIRGIAKGVREDIQNGRKRERERRKRRREKIRGS